MTQIADKIGVGVIPKCPECGEAVDRLEVKYGVIVKKPSGENLMIDGDRLESYDFEKDALNLTCALWPGGDVRRVFPCEHKIDVAQEQQMIHQIMGEE